MNMPITAKESAKVPASTNAIFLSFLTSIMEPPLKNV